MPQPRSLFVILPFCHVPFLPCSFFAMFLFCHVPFFSFSFFVILIPLCHSERSEESKPADVRGLR